VVATATIGRLSATDNTTKELSVDLTAPTVTIKAQDPTTSTRPAITGTVSESTATITVVVAGKTYTATNNANGTWTLAANTITALSAGTYTVTATAKDAAGNKSTATSTIQIVVLPTIKVNTLSTTDRTPKLTGTVDNPTVAISVTVNGVTYAAVNNGDGTWTLADNTVASLADGTYDVVATATVSTDLKSTDSTTGELVIDTTAPTVTVTSQETTDTTPDLAGTVTESGATVTVTVNGKKYTATNSSGKWTLAGTDLTALAPGVYDVTVSAKDAAGNVGTDATTDELTIVPVVTVNSLTTNDTTPKLSGTVTSSGATVTVTVDGVDYQAVNHGDGLWALADNTIAALAEGTYEVTVTATLGDLTATDSTVNELAIDTTAPGVTVTAQEPTTSTSPAITGTVGDEEATITVEVAHKTYTATNFTDGTWELSADTITALAAGTYTVTATAEDAAGNKATATSTIQIVVLPTIGVDTISTTDGTPELTGTISDPTAAITVTVNGVDYAAVNNGNGSWTLADNTVAELSEGVWEVVATVKVTDALESTASGELTIDTQAPEVTVDDLDTTETAPALTGTVTETGATVTVTIDSKDYTATNNGDGTWSLTLLGMKPGTYDVAVTAKDAAGNSGTDATTDELRVLPVVTIDSLSTNDTTPKLTGTVSSHTATVTVTVNGVDYTAVNNADTDNTWTLADNTVAALAEGTYDVTVTATLGTLTNTDDTVNELVIDTTAPGVTVKPVEASTETRPELSGTVGDSEATVTVMVANKNYAATNNGDGTWTLEADTISALAAGTRSVTVTAKDAAGNTATASTTIEVLNIPTVTIDSLVTSYNSPELTGTVDDPDATVWVVVNGSSFDATNNGDGTWTLAADTLSTLSVGTYDVAVYGVNTQSDWGIDQTSDELRIIAQTSVTMNYWGVRYVYYTDPDGTKVSVTIGTTSRRISGGLVLSFDSDAIVTTTTKPLGDTWYAMYLTCDAGVVVSGLNVYTATPSVTFKTAGGSISGSTIGGIAGSSVLTTLKAPTMTLIDNGIQMSTSAIQFIYLRSIQDADVTMAGLANGSVVFSIARSVSGSQISVTDGSIKSFSAGSLINSSVFVGVMGSTDSNGDTVYDLPVATDLRKGFSIGTLRVTGYSGATGDLFANSNIAVDSIGSVSLVAAGLSNRPDTDADGEPNDAHEAFGLTANSIKSLQLKQNKKSYRWIKGVWSGGFDPQDLTVRVS
ncbi:MAG: Ig-like domain-containing protein, partial [Planctomycetota bacterium]|nr:Ig-like domain-containing protein [Planctomycetota bacterium]